MMELHWQPALDPLDLVRPSYDQICLYEYESSHVICSTTPWEAVPTEDHLDASI